MIQKLAILSILVAAATCTYIHQVPIPIYIQAIPQIITQRNPNNTPRHTSNYNFAYNVNEPRTGDFKNQQESKRGDIVTGQYSLIQPDGVRRTVDYRADDLRGFQATVNNDRPNASPIDRPISNEDPREINEQRVFTQPQIFSTPGPLGVPRMLVQSIGNSRQQQNLLWDQ